LEPAAAVAAGATGQVDYTQGFMDFVCLQIGFTSESVGFPATAGRFTLQIQDIQASKNFQPLAWDVTAFIGGNFGVADNNARDLPVPWVFMEKTTIRAIFGNRAALACLPTLLLIGYLTDWARDATAAQANQELDMRVKRIQAGMVEQREQWQQ
jgi:hypothetical protein